MTKIMLHGCTHPVQDKLHGVGMRVFNRTTLQDGKVWRCTVCGGDKAFGASPEEEKKMNKKAK